jgi:hypothetical protein
MNYLEITEITEDEYAIPQMVREAFETEQQARDRYDELKDSINYEHTANFHYHNHAEENSPCILIDMKVPKVEEE